ncbi:MAG: hypothetical protein K0B15_16020 [Lentimicrobium sp.]|nr:hypothetical protein [Lentimicrobium sp.]
MKTKILLIVFMIAMIMGAFAQKPAMTLTFTADSNAQHVPLNSILIENLTQGGDTTLYAPDTVLVLDYITGMNENFALGDNSISLSQNFPNPMKGQTTVSLYLPERNDILITISDVIGRELANQEFQLHQGTHSFTFYPGRESLYFLTARAENQTRTIKMFNSPTDANASGYCKLGYNGQQKTVSGDYKSGNTLNNFVFDLGDQLKFTSFTDQGERVITSSPTGDQTYYFNYTGDPCPGAPTVTDIDINVYNTVQIGNQCWMAENLKVTHYSNGDAIPNVTGDYQWGGLTTGAYCWYDNEISWKDAYGALYNWYAVNDSRELCPIGWHVPTDAEWATLINFLGGDVSAGGKNKSTRTEPYDHPRWDLPNTAASNESGFSGLPGGYRESNSPFKNLGGTGRFWSSIEQGSGAAWGRSLNVGSSYMTRIDMSKKTGFSVRCLRD